MDDVVFKPSLQPKQSGDNTTKRKSDSILVDQARSGATLVKGSSEGFDFCSLCFLFIL